MGALDCIVLPNVDPKGTFHILQVPNGGCHMYSCLACWGGFPIVVTVDACLIGLLVARSRVGAPLHQVLQARRPLVWLLAWTDGVEWTGVPSDREVPLSGG